MVPLPDPARTVFTVHFNRRRLWLILAVSVPLAALALCVPAWTELESFFGGFARGLVIGAPIVSVLLLIRKRFLVYDLRSRVIVGPPVRGKNSPRIGFDRLEYSVYDATIYWVDDDGRRRKAMRRSPFADQQEWAVVVDLVIADQEARRGAQPPGHVHAPSEPGSDR
jgi:hypothetical protein